MRVNIANYQAIQILRNVNLVVATAKINEESNEDANLITAKNVDEGDTPLHTSLPDQDNPVQVHSGQTVYMYTPMMHIEERGVGSNGVFSRDPPPHFTSGIRYSDAVRGTFGIKSRKGLGIPLTRLNFG